MSIYGQALSAFNEAFADNLNEVGELEGDAPTGWQDTLAELADGLVPIYNSDRVHEWAEDGYPDPDDDFGTTNILQLMAYALYDRYYDELSTLADKAGFND